MKKIFILTIFIILQGCATKVELNTAQNNLLQSMTESKANSIINKAFKNSKTQSGLFGSNGSPFISNPKVLRIQNGVVTYADYEATLTNAMKKAILDLKWVNTVKFYTFDFRNVEKIRIVNSSLFKKGILKSINGVQFGIHNTNGNFVNIDVEKEYFDSIIAATKFYSPNAAITSGIGM